MLATRLGTSLALLFVACGACAPRPTRPALPASTPASSKWEHESEQGWLASEIAVAITSLAHFARSGEPASPAELALRARQVGDSATFEIRGRDGGSPFEVRLAPHFFAPEAWAPLARHRLARVSPSHESLEADLPERLADLRLPVLHAAHVQASAFLSRNPRSAGGHEAAGLVLAAFALRESAAGHSDPRRVLARLTAHLAIAQALRGGGESSAAGRVATMALLVLVGREGDAALAKSGVPAWDRALQLFATQNWRQQPWEDDQALVERLAWLRAYHARVDSDRAHDLLQQLPAEDAVLPDWGRIRLHGHPSVRDCHAFAVGQADVDLAEAQQAHAMFRGRTLAEGDLVAALNEEAASSPVVQPRGAPARIEVLDWGTVAAFVQRHLGARLSYEVSCLENTFGLPDAARQAFAAQEQRFGSLTLWPLEAHRWTKTPEAYRPRAEAAARLLRARPDLVTPFHWVRLREVPAFAAAPDVPEVPVETTWFRPRRPIGTYFMQNRLWGPWGELAVPFEELSELSRLDPFDTDLRWGATLGRLGRDPVYEEIRDAWGPALEWDSGAVWVLFDLSKAKPLEQRSWAEKLCEMRADSCPWLGESLVAAGEAEAAARVYRRWWREASDRVLATRSVRWLVFHELAQGRAAAAWEIAQEAAATGSASGLRVLGELAEKTGDLDLAEDSFRRIAARYGYEHEVYAFCDRQVRAGRQDYEARREASLKRAFPRGMEPATALAGPPLDGVQLGRVEPAGVAAGLRDLDIVVALDGIRVHDESQWEILRLRAGGPEMQLMVYRGGSYLTLSTAFAGSEFPARVSGYPGTR